MEPEYEFIKFNRKPFSVEAIQITEENIHILGPLVGEVKVKDGETFISLDRRIIPSVRRAYVGWWITRLNENLRCYSPKIFEEQFEVDEGYVAPSQVAVLPTGEVVTTSWAENVVTTPAVTTLTVNVD